MMLVGRHGGGWQIYEAEGQKDLFEYGHHTRMQMAHVENFVSCIRSREQPNADIRKATSQRRSVIWPTFPIALVIDN